MTLPFRKSRIEPSDQVFCPKGYFCFVVIGRAVILKERVEASEHA